MKEVEEKVVKEKVVVEVEVVVKKGVESDFDDWEVVVVFDDDVKDSWDVDLDEEVEKKKEVNGKVGDEEEGDDDDDDEEEEEFEEEFDDEEVFVVKVVEV